MQAPARSPLFLRQKPVSPPPVKPAPLTIREKPPLPPPTIPPKVVVIPGRVHPPPPRKVVVERLPKLPAPPADVIIERWLGYAKRTRRIKFEPAAPLLPAPAPRNLLIEWETPETRVEPAFTFLGVQEADPAAYVAKYGQELVTDLPAIARDLRIELPANETLGLDYRPEVPRLVGDVHALRFVNLDAAGLQHYKPSMSWTPPSFCLPFNLANMAGLVNAF